MKFSIPQEVLHVTQTLQKAKHEAYLIGGCVRDLLMEKTPKDWDVTTNATPEQIQGLFKETFYENEFGTVGVVNEATKDKSLRVVEVTPYRIEEKYSDKRRPDAVTFSTNIEDDLKRRDFTINAIALDPKNDELLDLYEGQKDIEKKIIRAVGDPKERFEEDALRIMRAVRIATELEFTIEEKTGAGIKQFASNLSHIAIERIRDEFSRIVMSQSPMHGITLLHGHGILKYIIPELETGINIKQNGDHIYHVWEHNLRALEHSAQRDWPLHVRLSSLFHDISKPETRQWSDDKKDWTFYGHDVVGARVAKKILTRMKYPKKTVDTVCKLVRWHLFFSDIDKITLSAVRRLIRNVGEENVWGLMKVRACDRIGMGRPKEKPYRLRKYESMIEEALRAPVSVGMLKIDGDAIIKLTGEKPGPRIGFILHTLLEEMLDAPENNIKKYLEKRTSELVKLSKEDLQKLGERGKKKREEEDEKELEKIRKRYYVK